MCYFKYELTLKEKERTMKAIVTKATINEGVSKKQDPKGREYQISTITILVPFEPREWNNNNGHGSSRGFGLDTTEIELHPEALNQFRDLSFPAHVELETETEYRRNGAVSVVVGVKPLPQLKTA
jgi:hypothetical protein